MRRSSTLDASAPELRSITRTSAATGTSTMSAPSSMLMSGQGHVRIRAGPSMPRRDGSRAWSRNFSSTRVRHRPERADPLFAEAGERVEFRHTNEDEAQVVGREQARLRDTPELVLAGQQHGVERARARSCLPSPHAHVEMARPCAAPGHSTWQAHRSVESCHRESASGVRCTRDRRRRSVTRRGRDGLPEQ